MQAIWMRIKVAFDLFYLFVFSSVARLWMFICERCRDTYKTSEYNTQIPSGLKR